MSGDFSTFRGARVGDYFDSWPDFLNRYFPDHASLGQTIRSINQQNRKLTDDADSLPGLAFSEIIAPARSTPWPTFVLGSGCLSARDWAQSTTSVDTFLEDAIARATTDPLLRHLTFVFIDNLSRNRSNQPSASAALTPAPGIERGLHDWNFIAQTALAAMLLTRLYGEAIAHSPQVVSDSHDEEILIPASSGTWADTYREVGLPLEAALAWLAEHKAPSSEGAQLSLGSLAASIQLTLQVDRQVRRSHVELITAFAWFFLTEGTLFYPDWSDLLLFEAFMDTDLARQSWRDATLKPRTSPISTTDAPVASWLTKRLQTISENSWRSRTDSAVGTTPRDEFYDAVAALLSQQAANYHSIEPEDGDGDGHKPPLPTCFVTTFDLELEMAMWQQSLKAAEPAPFIVIVPVVMSVRNGKSVKLDWVWREITPASNSDALTALRESGPGAWHLISVETPPPLLNDPATRGRTAVIVRLAGSPLMNVDLADDRRKLRQALLLDEYTAVSLTVLDLASAAAASMPTPPERSSGLPTDLTSTNLSTQTAYMPRYWMFLGAQLSDAGVRLRLLSNQITFAQENIKSGVSDNIAGVAINRRSRPTDRDVFHWYGVDVVGADVQSETHNLTEDLQKLHAELAVTFTELHSDISNARKGAVA